MTDETPSSRPADETTASAASAAPAANAAPQSGNQFEEYYRKFLEQVTDLGNHVGGIQQTLTEAAAQAKTALEKELQTLKESHPEAWNRLHELREHSDENLAVLRGRLDKLAGELEQLVGGFVGTITEQAKKAVKTHVRGASDAEKADAEKAAPADPNQP
jgi:phage shock protein A